MAAQTEPISNTALISNKALWAARVLSGLVDAILLFDCAIKLITMDIVVQTSQELGIPVHLARTLGMLTLAGTVLYAMPRTSVLGAILLTGYLGGAIYTHVRAGSPFLTHTFFGVYLGVLIWGGLWLRDDRIRALIPFAR